MSDFVGVEVRWVGTGNNFTPETEEWLVNPDQIETIHVGSNGICVGGDYVKLTDESFEHLLQFLEAQ